MLFLFIYILPRIRYDSIEAAIQILNLMLFIINVKENITFFDAPKITSFDHINAQDISYLFIYIC